LFTKLYRGKALLAKAKSAIYSADANQLRTTLEDAVAAVDTGK